MRVGLVDVDGHNFPNLALMRISQYHKSMGDIVSWWDEDGYYDIVYKSKIFSSSYTEDIYNICNCDNVLQGGTGYCISNIGGVETYDKRLDIELPERMERMRPDYSIYPQYNFAVSMTSRGCPRGCPFCHVSAKEGRKSVKVADVCDFYDGQEHIEVLDPNITACDQKRNLFAQYREVCAPRVGATIEFNQGLDIRLIDDYDIEDINHLRIKKRLHFAWDNPREDLRVKFEEFKRGFRRKSDIGLVYVLVNFNSSMEENLYRIYTLRDMGFDPFVMVYDKPNASKDIRSLQRWCNNKIVFKSCPKFDDYDSSI